MESKKKKLRKFIKDTLIIINEKITALTPYWIPKLFRLIIPENQNSNQGYRWILS